MIDRKKMSKSRGTFIKARTYLNHFNPEYLRYYFASKLTNGITDINLNLNDFVNRINSELIGKVINIANRSAKFIHKYYDGYLGEEDNQIDLIQEFIKKKYLIFNYYEQRKFNKIIKEIIRLAD